MTRFCTVLALGLRFAGASTAISLSNSVSGMLNLSFSILGSNIGCDMDAESLGAVVGRSMPWVSTTLVAVVSAASAFR